MKWATLAILVVALSMGQLCRAAQPLEVTSLDFGGCWTHQERFEDPLWKGASFSDRVAFTILASDFQRTLNEPITSELRSAFDTFKGSATETFFHCSAGGHFFWTSIQEGTVPLCVWSKMAINRDSGMIVLTVLGVFPDHEFSPSVPCNGVTRRSLLVVLNQEKNVDWIMAYLRTDKRYTGSISNLSTLGRTTLLLTLTAAYDFREDVVKALIESDELLAGYLGSVSYNGRVAIVGENQRLFTGNYPGF